MPCSRLGKAKVVFGPYNSGQIETIAEDRLKTLPPIFAKATIKLAARKVASVSGDVRRALELLRQAAEIWESEQSALRPDAAQCPSSSGAGKGVTAAGQGGLITASYVTRAFQAMFNAPHMQARCSAAVHCCVVALSCPPQIACW